MSRLLPSEILTDDIFKRKLRSLMRGFAGIYALYKGDTLYYVGLTRNLFGRISWHLKDRHARKWDRFKIFRIKRIRFLKDIETLVQNIVETKGNRAMGKVPHDADFNRTLHELLREHERKIKAIRSALR